MLRDFALTAGGLHPLSVVVPPDLAPLLVFSSSSVVDSANIIGVPPALRAFLQSLIHESNDIGVHQRLSSSCLDSFPSALEDEPTGERVLAFQEPGKGE